ncbi:hypothetical protein T439DRAFT_308052 [Meredithblackwellia eburnea MCA 4105]
MVRNLLRLIVLASGSLAQLDSYAPTLVTCPVTVLTRTGSPLPGSANQTLDSGEATYIQKRRTEVLAPLWETYLSDTTSGSTGYNISHLFPISSSWPRVSTSVSGGGYRAALYGAGSLSALDSRNATNAGPFLQLSEYLSGLSGGSWIVSSLAMADLPDLFSLVLGLNGENGWALDMGLLDPDGVLGIADNTDYYQILLEDVRAKANAGFPVSLVDLWGRALSFHFFNGTTRSNFYDEAAPHDQGLQWSSIKYTPNFQSWTMPLPLVVSTSRVSAAAQTSNTSDTTVIPLANTQFEFTPYTMGSFDPSLAARVPIEWAGSYLVNGVPINSTSCVSGYENAGFVIGTSAALFNAAEEVIDDPNIISALSSLGNQLADVSNPNYSIPLVANWPNSFKDFVPEGGATFESAGNDILQLTDGGENGENIPLGPLLVKARGQDMILALDSSADTDFFWPNGTSLIATADRIAGYFQRNFSSFPPIPKTAEDFVQQGLNLRPTFFGCNTTGNGNSSVLGNYPIVVYLPNSPPVDVGDNTYLTNTSTFKLDYSMSDQVSFLEAAHQNGLKGFTANGQTQDPDWPLCLKCAAVDRARTRAGVERSAACSTCLNKYCWSDGIADALVNATASASNSVGTQSTSNASLSKRGRKRGALMASASAVLMSLL